MALFLVSAPDEEGMSDQTELVLAHSPRDAVLAYIRYRGEWMGDPALTQIVEEPKVATAEYLVRELTAGDKPSPSVVGWDHCRHTWWRASAP